MLGVEVNIVLKMNVGAVLGVMGDIVVTMMVALLGVVADIVITMMVATGCRIRT